MSRYIGKRVSYECGFCKKQFTLNKQSIDDSEKSGEVFCSKQCSEQFYLSDVSARLSSSLGEVEGNAYEVVFDKDGSFWINHKEVGSGEPLKQWIDSVLNVR